MVLHNNKAKLWSRCQNNPDVGQYEVMIVVRSCYSPGSLLVTGRKHGTVDSLLMDPVVYATCDLYTHQVGIHWMDQAATFTLKKGFFVSVNFIEHKFLSMASIIKNENDSR